MLLAAATVLGYIEAVLLPALPLPGMKIGLANLAVLIALVMVGPGRALVVSVGRVFLVALATGTLGGPTMLLALTGAFLSWWVMAALFRQGDTFSIVGCSIAGGCAHVVGQLVAAVIVTSSPAAIMLLPFALAVGIVAGALIGFLAHLLISRVPVLRQEYVSV
jgi:heptaprenyl diphosphate synthase